jgi:hypothetical protein
MTKQSTLKWILQVTWFLFGLVSILGGIAALLYGYSREPQRYWVAAIVMLVGGILWIVYSISSKYQLSKKHIVVILITVLLGLTVGLFYTFSACGGECGGSFCRWERGYPGRWFVIRGCYGPTDSPLNFQLAISHWHFDGVSLLADIVFWSAAGLIIVFLWQSISPKTNQRLLQD